MTIKIDTVDLKAEFSAIREHLTDTRIAMGKIETEMKHSASKEDLANMKEELKDDFTKAIRDHVQMCPLNKPKKPFFSKDVLISIGKSIIAPLLLGILLTAGSFVSCSVLRPKDNVDILSNKAKVEIIQNVDTDSSGL